MKRQITITRMHRTRIIFSIFICFILVLLTACTGDKDNPGKPSTGGSDSKFAETSVMNTDSQKEESSFSESSKPEEPSKPEESSKPV